MEIHENIEAVADRWMKEVWQQRNIEAVDELHAPHFVDHSSAGRAADNQGYKKGLEELFRAFPDFLAKTEDLIVDADKGKAVIRWSATGTHQENFMDVPPTGKRIAFRGIEILKIEENLITDRWGEWDGIDLMEQLR